MKKSILRIVFAFAIITLFTAPGFAKTTMKLAFNQDKTHPQYVAMEEFGKKLAERTKGEYSLEIFPNELLGAQKETLEMVQSGSIEMAIVANALLEGWNADFLVFNLPYVFSSVAHQRAVVNDPQIVGKLYDSVQNQGVKVLAAFHGGVRNVYAKKAIKTPADLKGLKIRVMQSDTNLAMMNQMGGTGIAMGQGEVYTAIQTGVLDGAENNELIYNNLLQYEVAPFYNYTKHLMQPDMLTISVEIWNKLPADVKKIFNEEIPKAVVREFDSFSAAVEKALAAVKTKGVTITTPDITPFQQAVASLTESKLKTEEGKKIYLQIKATEAKYK